MGDTTLPSPSFLGRPLHEMERRPWLVAVLALLLATLLVRPFGNYPLNDDWHYARIAKNFAETGRFALDSPVASSLYGQTLLAWPIISAFGFSHTALHLETLVLGMVGLWALDALMSLGDVAPRMRAISLLTLALNPLFFYTANSFMTEFYGYVPGLFGAVFWFRSRKVAHARGDLDAPAVSYVAAALSGALFGFAFWVRQFCAAIYPALPGATILALLFAGHYKAALRTLPRVATGAVVYAAIVLSFFPWAKATGNFTPQFQGALGNVTKLEPETLFKHGTLWLIYMALFFAPLLVLLPWRRALAKRLVLCSSVLIVVACLARYMIRDVRMDWLHPKMPFLGNIIEDTGLGPITLSDVYWAKLNRPKWGPAGWSVVEAIAVHGVALFAPMVLGVRRFVRETRQRISFEITLFGVLASLGSLFLSIQAYKMETLDRYHLPSLLLMPLVLAIGISSLRGELSKEAAPLTPRLLALSALALLPLAWFSIAGLHDYFRWNDARWALFRESGGYGASSSTVEGGYEMNGWLHYDDLQAKRSVVGCVGPCRCTYATWYTQDCSFHIGMNVLPGFTELRSIQPSYWLAPGPKMTLSKRMR